MPIHDWTRVRPGIFHDFHQAWIIALRSALNDGLLPPDYYALGEQVTSHGGPDVLTLQKTPETHNGGVGGIGVVQGGGAVAVLTSPPAVECSISVEAESYQRKRSVLSVRHSSDDRVIAMIEIVSPGNKNSEYALRTFVQKAVDVLTTGVHLLIIDLHPPGPRDPAGIHGAIWSALSDAPERTPLSKPLQLAAYVAAPGWPAYLQSAAVGESLKPMPLFLTPDFYVPTPLEPTYQAAYMGVPQRWKRVLDAPKE